LGYGARIVRTLEDAPFYSRSLLDTRLLGSSAPAIHESLDLDRFRARWVQCLLPFRMPRSLT
jgi:carotenoid 1,2-hydratase